ncbi:MAG TPA: cysteine--tRNA ligase, partial [Alphaproteobacteria bacterium]|nr:cysteine--tRNA ligase [Alphaproteobacteria bacterium]
VEPRATEHIPGMIAMIERLLAGGHAYEAQGHVLFDIASKPDYGKLSGRDREEMIAGARVEIAPYKRDPADFVLWKPSNAEEPGWPSPWGRGRPGWHIECSAMSERYLGDTFDIHGGGLDLVFPHHENELAQSECAHGKPFVRYWVHNGYVNVDSEKMSKSLGNFVTVHELLAEGIPGEVLRLVLIATHYRQPLDFTRRGIEQARARLDRWYRALRAAAPAETGPLPAEFEAALDDDLNTPLALTVMDALAGETLAVESSDAKAKPATALLACGQALGLLAEKPDAWFAGGAADAEVAEIERLIAARNEARKVLDFAAADRIRDELAARGILLEDTAQGTSWRRKG